MGELQWGRRYLMVPPTHFEVAYAINPFMDTSVQPDPARVREQYAALASAITDAGGEIVELDQRPDSPDMVFAMNLGLFVDSDDGPGVVLSHMRFPERRAETLSLARWATAHGYRRWRVGRDGIGAHFESGDAFAWRGELLVGHGFRTDELAVKHLATDLGVTTRGIRITHPGMYHLDLSFCPLDETCAIVCPDAYDDISARRLLDLVPDPLVITEVEAMTFCANSIVVGRTVIMPACPARVRARLEGWGFGVVVVEVSEYLKGGGAIRCLTGPLDVHLGRDLALR